MAEHFDDRVTIQVTTTRAGASDALESLENFVKQSENINETNTWVTVAPVEKPESMTSVSKPENPIEESWA